MAVNKAAPQAAPELGRKHLSVAKTRQAILVSAQEVLSEHGSEVPISKIAEHAGVTEATIYNHFKNRETLLMEAFVDAFSKWEEWVFETIVHVTDPLERIIFPARILTRLRSTHPMYAKLISKNLEYSRNLHSAISDQLIIDFERLEKSRIHNCDDLKNRVKLMTACFAEAVNEQLLNQNSPSSVADGLFEIALELVKIPPAKAKKLAHSKLPLDVNID